MNLAFMATFNSTEQLYQVLGGFFKLLSDDPNVGPKLKDSKLKLRFFYREPDGAIFVDFGGDTTRIEPGNTTDLADVEMSMKADTAHKFWLGNVMLPIALARREITAKGPIPKILKLLPIIKPAYALYPEYIKTTGLA